MLELKEFISQSLSQIFEGVKEAQALTKESNGIIMPKQKLSSSTKEIPNHQSIIGYIHQIPVISVDFNVSITTQDVSKDKAGAGIFVAAIGLGGQIASESINNQLTKLNFSIPVILPSSDKQPVYQ